MDQYVTGAIIKRLREENKMTQSELSEKINVSSKTISKWETAKGYPDITLLEPLSSALGVSVAELISGNNVVNSNKCANMLRAKFHVCPVCGNVIYSVGEAVISCHGIILPGLDFEDADEKHSARIETAEDEYFINIEHEMTKTHYISFMAAVSDNGVQIIKLYPESEAEARFKISRTRMIFAYCNRDGLFRIDDLPLRRRR